MHIIFHIGGGEKEWRRHNGLQISTLSSSQPQIPALRFAGLLKFTEPENTS